MMESIEAYLKEDNSQENESYMVKIPQRINLQNNEELLFIRSDDYGIITCQESEQEEILGNFTIEIRKKSDRKDSQEISIVSDKIVDHMLEIEVEVVKTPVKILPKKLLPPLNSKSKLHIKPGKSRKEATKLSMSGNPLRKWLLEGKARKEVFDRKGTQKKKEQKSDSTDLTTTTNTKHLNHKESILTLPGPSTDFLPGNVEGKRLLGGAVEYKTGKYDIKSIDVKKKVAQETTIVTEINPGNEVTGNDALCVDRMRLLGDVIKIECVQNVKCGSTEKIVKNDLSQNLKLKTIGSGNPVRKVRPGKMVRGSVCARYKGGKSTSRVALLLNKENTNLFENFQGNLKSKTTRDLVTRMESSKDLFNVTLHRNSSRSNQPQGSQEKRDWTSTGPGPIGQDQAKKI